MDMQNMLEQMCKSDLSDSDLKAICKSRGFPEKEAASRDVFENFFLSTIGIKEVLNSLTYEEVVFLHLLNKINKEVEVAATEDRKLIGGVVMKLGTMVVDGSLAERITESGEKMKQELNWKYAVE